MGAVADIGCRLATRLMITIDGWAENVAFTCNIIVCGHEVIMTKFKE